MFFFMFELRMRIRIFFMAVQLMYPFFGAYAESSKHPQLHTQAETSLRQLIKSVDYMRGDYPGAVGPGGRILDDFEYKEMLEFVEDARTAFSEVSEHFSATQREALDKLLSRLKAEVEGKASGQQVADLCLSVRRLVYDVGLLQDTPYERPSLALARRSFATNCASCHGENGAGNGPLADSLEPRPANFHVKELMQVSSPAKFFNIIITGIDSMPSFGWLSKHERWSLAFYIHSLRYGGGVGDEGKRPLPSMQAIQSLNLEMLAKMDDASLFQQLVEYASSESEALRWVEWVRTEGVFDGHLSLSETKPSVRGAKESSLPEAIQSLVFAQEMLLKALAQVVTKDYESARKSILDAYLDYFEKYEKSPRQAPDSDVFDAERLFVEVRTDLRLADEGEKAQSAQKIQQLVALLTKIIALEGQKVVAGQSAQPQFLGEYLSWDTIFSAMVIILREGLEAFLIVAALLAMLSQLGYGYARKWVHLGWVLALFAGALTYIVLQRLVQLSGMATELLEGVFTGVAVLLLYYTGFWLFSQSEHQRWQGMVKEKYRKALEAKQLGVIVVMSFVAVFRESVETILFYEALKSSGSVVSIVVGFLIGASLLFLMCQAIMRYNSKLPLRQFFKVTSTMMVVIAIVLAGKTVMEFIEADFLSPTYLSFIPRVELLGVFPYLESVSAQLALLFGALGFAGLKKIASLKNFKQA